MTWRNLAMTGVLALSGALGASLAGAAESRLADVIQAGDRATALQLVRSGADVNAAQLDGTTPLHWAVYAVDTELTQALLAKGAKAEVRNRFGATPLAEAAKVANVDLVRALLRAGAKADTANEDGQTPLMLAARTGVVDVAKELVKAGAKVNARENWRGQTALMWAAGSAQPDMTAFLIARGADVNLRADINDFATQVTSEPRAQYRPSGGLTPLLYAARSGCGACVASLLKAGADIDRPTPDGVTPLMTAIDNLQFDVAKQLLERGANPHLQDWWGRTALYVATDMNSFGPRGGGAAARGSKPSSALEVMRLLLDKGVNPNPQLNMHRPGRGGNSGRFTDDLLTVGATPLLRAAIGFDNDAIRLLLERGALVDLPNGMGVTPLMAAAGLGVSIRDPRGNYGGDAQARVLPTLELLVKAGADVNARVTDTSGHTARIARPSTMTDRQGQTAIYGPINWGWTKVVQYLLDHGARVDVTDANGKTPLDAANGNAGGRDFKSTPEILAMIQKAGGKPGATPSTARSGG
jgi:ankyrin repeat protein